MLEVVNLTKRFGGLVANNGVSFRVEPGQIMGVIGPNGAGKSTLFELITGFLEPSEGEIRLDGRSIVGLRPIASNIGASDSPTCSSVLVSPVGMK